MADELQLASPAAFSHGWCWFCNQKQGEEGEREGLMWQEEPQTEQQEHNSIEIKNSLKKD